MDPLEQELNKDDKPVFPGTGVPGRPATDFAFRVPTGPKPGEFGKKLANNGKDRKLLVDERDVLLARLAELNKKIDAWED